MINIMSLKSLSLYSIVALFLLNPISVLEKTQDNLRDEENQLPLRPGKAEYWQTVIGVVDDPMVQTTGEWNQYFYRRSFPTKQHLHTDEDGATLKRTFDASGLALVLESHIPYVYSGSLNDGILEVAIDGEVIREIYPLTEANEIVLYRDREPQPRRVSLRHWYAPNGGRGVRIIGFRELSEPAADLAFFLTGEAGDLLVDARVTVLDGNTVLRTVVQRNWMSGMVRLTDVPPGEGYTLRIDALGWKSVTLPLPPLHAGSERWLTPVHLRLNNQLLSEGFERPRLGYPAVKRPGDSLNLHFAPHQNDEPLKLLSLRWEQTIGKARRRVLLWEGSNPIPAEGMHMSIDLPDQPLQGMGDLVAYVHSPDRAFTWRAPRSLHLRDSFPDQPVFLTLGHLDTWGHYQGEYLATFADMANLINPDAVLISNEVHPAYTAGGLKNLNVPHLVTIGNHTFGYVESPSFLDSDGTRRPGPDFPFSVSVGEVDQGFLHREPHYDWHHTATRDFDRWYGDPIGVVEIGPEIAVLNYGWSWVPEHNHEAIKAAWRKFESYRESRIRVLNAYESEPTRDFLDHFDFALVHSAHAWPRARAMHADDPQVVRGYHFSINDGATTFIGKQSSDTYRIIRFADDRVESHSYAGHEHQPWLLDRHRVAPLRVDFDPADQTGEPQVHRARLINNYSEPFDACRIEWVLPKGHYEVAGGTIDRHWHSDDNLWTVLIVKADVPANEVRVLQAEQITR